jgi:hypothetical protein
VVEGVHGVSLGDPEQRRALRSIVFAITVFVLLALTWKIADLLISNPAGLREIVRYALLIIGLAMLGYVSENGIRAIGIKGPGGTEVEVTTTSDPDGPVTTKLTATASTAAPPEPTP